MAPSPPMLPDGGASLTRAERGEEIIWKIAN